MRSLKLSGCGLFDQDMMILATLGGERSDIADQALGGGDDTVNWINMKFEHGLGEKATLDSTLEAEDFEEALSMAKNTKYRLAGGIITNDISKAKKASDFLAVGQFSYNGPPSYRTEVAPFGGFGFSGNGEKEGILLAAEGFQRIRTFYNHN